MAANRTQPALKATRDMAVSLLTALRTAHESVPEPTAVTEPGPTTFSPTLMRMAEQRSRQARREQELRVRQSELRRAILRYEHKIELMRTELAQLEAEAKR